MTFTDEQLRVIIRTVQKHIAATGSPETIKYIVTKVMQKLSDEFKNKQNLPENS